MANITIDGLTALTSEPLDGSFVPIWESGATKKVSIANLLGGYLPLGGGTLTGSVALPDGSAASPAIQRSGGTSDGFYFVNNFFYWTSDGTARFGAGSGGLRIGDGSINFGATTLGSVDLEVRRAAASILAVRNGTTATELHISGTYTDASNYERLALRTAAGDYTIAAEASGTGTKRNLVFDGANRGAFIDTPSSGTDGDYEAAFGSILAILESHGLMSGA